MKEVAFSRPKAPEEAELMSDDDDSKSVGMIKLSNPPINISDSFESYKEVDGKKAKATDKMIE